MKKINFETKEFEDIKQIDLRKDMDQRDDFALKLFEIKGDLAYYNSNGEIIIDKSLNVVNGESDSL
ncbi:MAG: hypothetical protein IJO26_03060 [Clostridium sp.]|nr:hypothetical protein [Clostridium sp.]